MQIWRSHYKGETGDGQSGIKSGVDLDPQKMSWHCSLQGKFQGNLTQGNRREGLEAYTCLASSSGE